MLKLAPINNSHAHSDCWTEVLQGAVRLEFQVDNYIPSANDPVLFGKNCVVSGCISEVNGYGFCQAHLARWRAADKPDLKTWSPPPHRDEHPIKECLVTDCKRAAVGNFCISHGASFRKYKSRDVDEYARNAKTLPVWQADLFKLCSYPDCNFPPMPSKSPSQQHGFCDRHGGAFDLRRRHNPGITPEVYIKNRVNRRLPKFRFDRLDKLPRLELQYVIQYKHDEKKQRWAEKSHFQVVKNVIESSVNSILDWSSESWMTFLRSKGPDTRAFMRYAHLVLTRLRDTSIGLSVFDRDTWYLSELGFDPNEPMHCRMITFVKIQPDWLRQLVKQWIRWRINCGKRPNTLHSNVASMIRFVEVIAAHQLTLDKPSDLNRQLLSRYAEIIRARKFGAEHRLHLMGCLNQFLIDVAKHAWEPSISLDARYYQDELPKLTKRLPRFVPEYLMKQIEEEKNIAQLGGFAQQTILRVMIATGLRGGDVVRLKLGAVLRDSQGNVLIEYINHKFKREAVTVCGDDVIKHLEEQAKQSREKHPNTEWIFPRPKENPYGKYCYSTETWRQELQSWLLRIELKDENGRAINVSPHQFRHTYATRLVNKGISLDCIQILLDHKSSGMTQTYAQISLHTVRKAWEAANLVNVLGAVVPLTTEGPLGDLGWVVHNLSRAKQTLANGYCGRPLQQECPHPNACLTCPDFLTTAEFLPQHRNQYALTLNIIDKARAKGQDRLVAMNEPTLHNLENIIKRIENTQDEDTEPTSAKE